MSRRRAIGSVLLATWALCACTAVPSPTAIATPVPATLAASPSTAVPPTVAGMPSLAPAPSQAPTAWPLPAPSGTPRGIIHQLTTGGCCVQPYWSADSSQVRYVDRPSSGQPSGIWAVNRSGGVPVFVTARLGIYSPDEKLVAYLEGGQTFVERLGGERWRVANGGRAVVFSPDSSRIAWQANSSLFNLDRRLVQVWVAGSDGSGGRQLASLVGGSLAGWFADGQHLLVTSRDGNNTIIQSLSMTGGVLTPIATVPRLQGLALSPNGGWLAYAVAFSGDAGQDGLWVIGVDGHGVRRLDTFGSFAWRGEGRLLVVPLDATSSLNRLLEVDASTGQSRVLAEPGTAPFEIAQGNWSPSPDGGYLAFVSAADHNIWVLDLTE